MTKSEFGNYYQAFSPPGELKTFVKEYWIYDLKTHIGHGNRRELLQPILFPEVIFKIGTDYENYDLKQDELQVISTSTICGIQGRAKASKRINSEEKLLLIGIKFKYTGLYQLLDRPLIELYNHSIPKKDIANNFLNQLEDMLLNVGSRTDIIETLNNALTNYFHHSTLNNDCHHFTGFVNLFNSLSQLKEDTQLSYKQLERNFKKYIGITPKKYFILKRYLSFYESWLIHDHYNYIDLVYQHDFFDQNHLIKDFKSVLNQSPNQFKKTKNEIFLDYITRYNLDLL